MGIRVSLKASKNIPSDPSALFELEYILQSIGWRAFKPRAFSSFSFKRPFSSNASTYSVSMHRNVHDLHSNGCSCFLRKYTNPPLSAWTPTLSLIQLSLLCRDPWSLLTAAVVKWQNRCRGMKSLFKKNNKWNILMTGSRVQESGWKAHWVWMKKRRKNRVSFGNKMCGKSSGQARNLVKYWIKSIREPL